MVNEADDTCLILQVNIALSGSRRTYFGDNGASAYCFRFELNLMDCVKQMMTISEKVKFVYMGITQN